MASNRSSRILRACERNTLKYLKNMFKKKLKEDKVFVKHVVCEKIDGLTPLMIACFNSHLDIVRYLVTVCGADVNQTADWSALYHDMQGASPLLFAIIAGHQGIVKFLILAGADVNSTSHPKWTPVKAAIYLGLTNILQVLLDEGADIELALWHGPLCRVSHCTDLHYQIIDVLLKRAQKSNRASNSLPVYMFVLWFNENICSCRWCDLSCEILDAFKDVIAKYEEKKDPCDLQLFFRYAIFLLKYVTSESEKLKQHVIDLNDVPILLLKAMWRIKDKFPVDHMKNYKKYFRKLIALEQKRKGGFTMIHHVCDWMITDEPADFVPFLVELGANINAQDEDGDTPLHCAAGKTQSNQFDAQLVNVLLEHNAHIDMVNKYNETPIDLRPHDASLASGLNQPLRYQTLQCLAARAVCKYSIPYQDRKLVPQPCIAVIEQHKWNDLPSEENKNETD